jgi:hypothetical protein
MAETMHAMRHLAVLENAGMQQQHPAFAIDNPEMTAV